MIGVPLVALTFLLIGIVIGGWWLASGALVLFGLALALGFSMFGAFLGQRILQRPGREVGLAWALIAGVAILTLVSRVPILGIVVGAIAAVFGLGALAIAARRMRAATG